MQVADEEQSRPLRTPRQRGCKVCLTKRQLMPSCRKRIPAGLAP